MKLRFTLAAAVLLAACLVAFGASRAQAQSVSSEPVISSVTGNYMMSVLKEMGFAPELTKDDDGDPLIHFQVEGTKCSIFYFEGTDGHYQSIQYYVGYENAPTLDKINDWNRKHRFGRAYLGGDGHARMEFDVPLYGGVSEDHLQQTMRRWKDLISSFEDFLNGK